MSSRPSLPVPSKAALTALRGLVVGTSCTLALIAEDRRRKINQAMRAVENGERIKSNRKYPLSYLMMGEGDGGVEGLGLDLGQGLGLGMSGLPPPTTRLSLRPLEVDNGRTHRREIMEGYGDGVVEHGGEELGRRDASSSSRPAIERLDEAADASRDPEPDHNKSPLVRPIAPVLPKLPHGLKTGPSWMQSNVETVKVYSFPTVPEIIARIHEACDTRDHLQLSVAFRTVLNAMEHKTAPGNLDKPWMEATGRLCQACREEGRLDDAVILLSKMIARGPMEETSYFAYGPLALIEEVLARAERNHKPGSQEFAAYLELAVSLFIPKFVVRPTRAIPPAYRLGRRLLELCYSSRVPKLWTLFRRCQVIAGDKAKELVAWMIDKLYKMHDHRSAVRIFLIDFVESSPTEAELKAIADCVVDSVAIWGHFRADDVLKTMLKICKSSGKSTKLDPRWVIRLLTSRWKRTRSLEKVEAMFQELHTPTLRDSVYRHEHVYRIMIELALESGDKAKAESYFQLAVAQNPALASDVRLLGVFVRYDAAAHNWEAVHARFEEMNRNGRPRSKAYGPVFVPVLKAYAETHTVRETEVYLRSYIEDFGLPLCSYMVTLMSKQYGVIRDLDSLIAWLEYCSNSGQFKVDAAFTNSILARARLQWKFPFQDLRTLYRKLKALNPDFVDKHTEQIMMNAALSDSKYGGRLAKGRLLSLRMKRTGVPAKCMLEKGEDVALAMKEALTLNSPRRALRIYRRGVHNNVPFSQYALRLAIKAQMALSPNDFRGAYLLIRNAQDRGEDVNQVINLLLRLQLDHLTRCTRYDPTGTDDIIQTTFAEYQKAGVRLTEEPIHGAAWICLAAEHYVAAIHYALLAAHVRSGGNPPPPPPPAPSLSAPSPAAGGPCFSLSNFRILLRAYASLVDVEGLRDTIERGLARPYSETREFRNALRQARYWISLSKAREAIPKEDRKRALILVNQAIQKVVEARKKLRAEARRLEEEALRIMREAARRQGRPEVNFEDVPWISGRKKKKGQLGEEAEEGDDGDDFGIGYLAGGSGLMDRPGPPVVKAF
jgi:hypothetical protein